VALKFGSAAWVLKNGDEQILAASQVRFSRHPLGSTKLDGKFGTNWVCRTLLGEQKGINTGHRKHCSINRKGGKIKGA